MNARSRIGFSTTGAPLSWAIRKATGAPFSHVFLRFGGFVLHAHFKGVAAVPPSKFEATNKIVREYEAGAGITPEAERAAGENVCALRGKRYGFAQLIGYAAVLRGKHNPFNDGLSCSELGYLWIEGLRFAGAPLDFPAFNVNDVMPQDLDRALARSSHFRLVRGAP